MKHFILFCVSVILFTSCSAPVSKHDTAAPAPGTTSSEVSLAADRSQYDELRKDIPPEVRRENDELAFIRNLMASGDEEPQKIRDRFSKIIRDKREKFDRTANKMREDYSKHEKFNREAYMKKMKTERDEFMARKKLSSEKRKDFFDEQEAQRQDYFNDERDNRKDFESTATDARKNFEAYVTEKTNQFNQEMRDYTTSYYERRKQLDIKKRADEKAKSLAAPAATPRPVDSDLEEFKKIPKSPGTQLGTPGN